MVEFFSHTLGCPVCRTRFAAEVPVGTAPVAIETDFRPVFSGPDPVAAEVFACPSCRYAGYALAFEGGASDEEPGGPGLPPPLEPLGVPDDEELEHLRRWIRRGELVESIGLGDREPSPPERHLLAARCRDYLVGSDPLPLADLYLRGAWAARTVEEPELEQTLLLDAVEQLEIALDDGEVPPEDMGRIAYLAGELARRAGDFGRAVDLLGQVEAHVELDEEDDVRLLRLARRMESLASIQSAIPARMPSDEDLEAAASPDEFIDFGRYDEDEDEDEA